MNLVREHIDFKRGIDPKDAMGIGQKVRIKNWLDKYFIETSEATRRSYYEINDDLTIDVEGFFAMSWKGDFPQYIQFNKIYGNFIISNCELTTLRGCPKIVVGIFECCSNLITNLVGGPEEVDDYICSLNKNLKSLKGLAKKINGYIACNNKASLTKRNIPKGTIIKDRKKSNIHFWSQW